MVNKCSEMFWHVINCNQSMFSFETLTSIIGTNGGACWSNNSKTRRMRDDLEPSIPWRLPAADMSWPRQCNQPTSSFPIKHYIDDIWTDVALSYKHIASDCKNAWQGKPPTRPSTGPGKENSRMSPDTGAGSQRPSCMRCRIKRWQVSFFSTLILNWRETKIAWCDTELVVGTGWLSDFVDCHKTQYDSATGMMLNLQPPQLKTMNHVLFIMIHTWWYIVGIIKEHQLMSSLGAVRSKAQLEAQSTAKEGDDLVLVRFLEQRCELYW